MKELTETYGDLLRMMRTLRGFGSGEMAKKLNMDEGNYSRLESGKLAPPSTKEKVDKQLKPLDITKWQSQMLDLQSYISAPVASFLQLLRCSICTVLYSI